MEPLCPGIPTSHQVNSMKTYLYGICSALLLLAIPAPGALVFNDRFDYPDGPITDPPSSSWTSHGGTAGQVNVSDGAVALTQSESEDVNAPLSGGPYNTGNLYGSLVVNFIGLPGGEGGFFLHFKDAGTTQKARVYASTNGAAHGFFRLGIANGSGTPNYIAEDLSPTTSYRVVIRYHAAAPTHSTLWIDPASEETTTRRATAADTDRSANVSAIALRQSLASGDGIGNLYVDDLIVGTEFGDVAGANTPPTLTSFPDQDIGADEIVGPLPFSVSDQQTPASELRVSLASSNPALVSLQGVSFQGTGTDRTLSLRPSPGAQGVTTLTLTVSDGEKSSATSFQVVVGRPSITGPERAELAMNQTLDSLAFTIEDRESIPEQMTVTATSSNPSLLPSTGLQWSGSGAVRRLRLTPATGQTGVSTVVVQVSDGSLSVSNVVVVTVYPPLGVVLSEDFDRVDGSLIDPQGRWAIHAPDTGEAANVLVHAGQLVLSGSKAEDFHAALSGQPLQQDSGTILFAGMKLRFTTLPSSAGTFFAHFKDDHSGFRGRLYAATREASAGHYRLGVGSSSGAPVYLPFDLALGEDVRVVTKYNVTTGETHLWVNAENDSEPGVMALDTPSPIDITNWSFRQADGIGGIEVDELRVATRFIEALPGGSPVRLEIRLTSSEITLEWPSVDTVVLQRTTALGASGWQEVSTLSQEVGGLRQLRQPLEHQNTFYRLIRK